MPNFLVMLIVVFLLSCAAYAEDEFFRWNDGTYRPIVIKRIGVLSVNDLCLQRKKCMAIEAVKLIPRHTAKRGNLVGHPANDHCLAIGGKPEILKDSKKNQYNFCYFGDGSLVDSWQLFQAYQSRHKSGK